MAKGKQGAHLKKQGKKSGNAARSAHRAYDIYRTGGNNVPVRYRCLLRRRRISVSIDDDAFKEMLPDEIWCPTPEQDDPKLIIDAVYDQRLSYLIELKRLHTGHVFGFEHFLEYAELKAGRTRHTLDVKKNTLILPSCAIARKDLFKSVQVRGIRVATSIVVFEDGDRVLEVELSIPSRQLTALYVDPVTGLYLLTRHYPSAYHFIDEPTDLPWTLLGIPMRGLNPDRRIGYQSPKDSVES